MTRWPCKSICHSSNSRVTVAQTIAIRGRLAADPRHQPPVKRGRGRSADDAPAQRCGYGRGPVAHAELVVDAGQVRLDRGRAEMEPHADLGRRVPVGDERDDLRLALREPRRLLRAAPGPAPDLRERSWRLGLARDDEMLAGAKTADGAKLDPDARPVVLGHLVVTVHTAALLQPAPSAQQPR